MSTFQSLIALVALIFALSVIVQAIQELLKNLLGTKAKVMAQTITEFMGAHLTLPQVKQALDVRGLDLTSLENLNAQDFRQLLDGIPFGQEQLQGVVVSAENSLDKFKDNVAASYEAARSKFQKAYTTRNKWFALGLSLLVVGLLNANVILLYENISADQGAQQAIMAQATKMLADQAQVASGNPDDLGKTYTKSRSLIEGALENDPILVRTLKYGEDFQSPVHELLGLALMVFLVSLGAPFWNDVLKGMMGLNNALNGNGKKT